MKWFYIIAIICVAALTFGLPLWLIPDQENDYAGKIVRWDSYGDDVKSLDPATCGDTMSSGIQANFYEGLYTYHYLKRPVEVVPQLALEMPDISADGLTYTIRLKPNVKYQANPCFGKASGKRTVHAKDFELAFKRVADYHINTGLSWAFVSGRIAGLDSFREQTQKYKAGDFSRYDLPVKGLQVVDPLTLKITLVEPFPQMIYVLAMSVYAPIPREAVDYWLGRRPMAQRSTEFREAEQVVGTGPYVLKTFRRKHVIVLDRNPLFGDDPSVTQHRRDRYPSQGQGALRDPNGALVYKGDQAEGLLQDAGKPVPFIDVLHYDYVAETSAVWNRFLARQTDASGIPKETFAAMVRPDKSLEEQWEAKHIKLRRSTSPAVYWIVFNMEDPVIGKSKSLRQAMCLAFDVESYIKVLMNGRAVRALNVLPNTFKGWREAGAGPYYTLDLAEAKKKLEHAKAELKALGKLDSKGQIPELKIEFGSRDTESYRQGEFFQQQFQKLGLRVKMVYNDWPTLQEKVNNKSCQMYTMGWHADYPDAENFLQLYYSPNIAKQTNNSNYANPKFDRLYEKIRTMPDTPERTRLYAEMVQILNEDVPVLLLTEPETFVLYYDWLRNTKPHPIGYGYAKYSRIDAQSRRQLGGR